MIKIHKEKEGIEQHRQKQYIHVQNSMLHSVTARPLNLCIWKN